MKFASDLLKEVFGTEPPKEESIAVLNKPSALAREMASQAIQSTDLSTVLRDVGFIMARQISDELERMALKPGDYLDLPDMPQMVAARLGAEISKAPAQFVQALIEQMALRG